MNIFFVDGFDWSTNNQGIPTSTFTPQKYVNYSSGGSGSIQLGRVSSPSLGGGNCAQLESAGFRQATATRFLGTTPGTLVLGFAYEPIGGTTDNTPIVRIEAGHATLINPGGFDDGTNNGTVIWLRQMPDGTVNVYAGDGTQCGTPNFPGTFLATLTTVFTRGTWRYIELVASATGWSVYVDDVLDTTQLLVLPVGAGMDRYSFQKFGFESHRLDDHYAADTRLGPCRVTGLPPTVGSTHQWTPLSGTNLSQISEFGNHGSSTPDGDATYVASSNDGDVDLFAWAKPACYGRILAVAANVDARATAGSPSVNVLAKSGANTFTLGFGDSFTGSYAMSQVVALLNPATNATWTDADIANLLFGYQKTGGGTARVTQMCLEKLVSLRNVPFECGGGSYSFGS